MLPSNAALHPILGVPHTALEGVPQTFDVYLKASSTAFLNCSSTQKSQRGLSEAQNQVFLACSPRGFSGTGTFQFWVSPSLAVEFKRCQLGHTCQISRGVNPSFHHQNSISDHPLHQIGVLQMVFEGRPWACQVIELNRVELNWPGTIGPSTNLAGQLDFQLPLGAREG
eukprot:1148773-Pelagomonas_calceolata.AAC.6